MRTDRVSGLGRASAQDIAAETTGQALFAGTVLEQDTFDLVRAQTRMDFECAYGPFHRRRQGCLRPHPLESDRSVNGARHPRRCPVARKTSGGY